MITLENLKFHEMIGMQTKIIKSTNPQFNNIKGRIIDETKSTFTLSTTNRSEKISKTAKSVGIPIKWGKNFIKWENDF